MFQGMFQGSSKASHGGHTKDERAVSIPTTDLANFFVSGPASVGITL